jgi:hypothetical protein
MMCAGIARAAESEYINGRWEGYPFARVPGHRSISEQDTLPGYSWRQACELCFVLYFPNNPQTSYVQQMACFLSQETLQNVLKTNAHSMIRPMRYHQNMNARKESRGVGIGRSIVDRMHDNSTERGDGLRILQVSAFIHLPRHTLAEFIG